MAEGMGTGPIVLGEFWGEVCGEGRSLEWRGSGKLLQGTDVVIGGLKGGTKSRMRFEAGDRGRPGTWYHWRWFVTLEFRQIQVLDGTCMGRDSGEVEHIASRKAGPSGDEGG